LKKKFYVVWKGRKTGIFTSWEECRSSVEGFSGAKYKSFPTEEEARQAFLQNGEKSEKMVPRFSPKAPISQSYIEDSLSVDASSSGNPGLMEYRGVSTRTGEILFSNGPMWGTNNIGEFLAIVHGLGYLKERNLNIPIYSDSATAIKWVKMKKANTSLPDTKESERVWKLIRRAEKWLSENDYDNPILKWDTDRWGEIKADFGRK